MSAWRERNQNEIVGLTRGVSWTISVLWLMHVATYTYTNVECLWHCPLLQVILNCPFVLFLTWRKNQYSFIRTCHFFVMSVAMACLFIYANSSMVCMQKAGMAPGATCGTWHKFSGLQWMRRVATSRRPNLIARRCATSAGRTRSGWLGTCARMSRHENSPHSARFWGSLRSGLLFMEGFNKRL